MYKLGEIALVLKCVIKSVVEYLHLWLGIKAEVPCV